MHETGFTKLFNTIVTSTIWQEGKETKILWVTMLALANRYGEVGASAPGLANAANLTLQETLAGIKVLESPDEYSRSKAHEGRRIAPIEGGWQILNYAVYREKMRSRADYYRNYRNRKILQKTHILQQSATPLTTTQPIAEAEAEKIKRKVANVAQPPNHKTNNLLLKKIPRIHLSKKESSEKKQQLLNDLNSLMNNKNKLDNKTHC